MGNKNWLNYNEYIASDVWKCAKSPTGAHHWLELNHTNKLKGHFHCIHCFDVKQFPTFYSTKHASYGEPKYGKEHIF